MIRSKLRAAGFGSVAAVFALTAMPSGPVFAQAAAESDEPIEEIITTGSRIARTELQSVSPITIVNEEAIEFAGANSIATILNELPSAGVPGSVDTATNFRTVTTGLNTVDLRNLGTARTLILVNGRRHVGGSAGSPTVDVSMIPVSLVERVEVVTGGAAAAYGSEAISGVINFIMKDDFEGVELNTRYGSSDGVDGGGADEQDISILVGGNFGGERGNAVIYAGYSDRGILNSRDRDISANDAVNSSFGPKGVFFVPEDVNDPVIRDDDGNIISGTPGFFATLDEGTGSFLKPFNNAEDGFNRNQRRIIRVPSTRVQVNANINYELNSRANLFTEVAYNQLESFSRLEPIFAGQFISVGNLAANIDMPIDNPFMPDDLRDEILRRDPDTELITMRRRMVELGGRTSDVQRRVFRGAMGLNGELTDTLDYEVYYQYGNFGQDQTNGGVFNTKNFYDALRAEPDGQGGFQCSDSFARGLGCVPINVFGPGTITDEMLGWVGVDSQVTSRMSQQVVSASVSGYPVELWAGDLGLAVGYEWREEKSKFNSDSLAQSGLTSGNTTPNTVGEYDVNEFFIEAIVPLLSDAPAAEYLGLELAYRLSDYSTIGDADAYKVSLDWQPFDDLRVRGGVSTAVRAPFIDELFDPGSETFRNFVDPCALGGVGGPSASGLPNDVYETQTAAVQANCAQIPGTATLDPFALNIRSAGGLAAGNPNLEEESSDATTIGFVYTPSYVEGLSVTLDYFEINVDKAISSFTAQTTVDQCVRQPSFPNNPFCDLIQRDPVTGLVLRIDALAINVAEFEATGVDFSINYAMEVGPGDLRLNLFGTHSMSNDFIPFAGGNVVDSQGEIGVPDWKANLNASYLLDDWSFAWTTRYIDGVNIENDQLALGTISSYVYNDVQARYHFGDNNQFTAFVGIENVFDKEPPFLGQGIPGDVTGTNTAADVYDAIRRFWYLGFNANFDL